MPAEICMAANSLKIVTVFRREIKKLCCLANFRIAFSFTILYCRV